MKNLLGIISLFAIASLAVLAVASVLGFSSPSWSLVTRVIGFSWAAGVLAMFVTDYAPRRSYSVGAVEPAAEAVPEIVPAKARPYADAVPAMATFGLANDPATVSLM
jgi:hypothetical protein